MNFNSPYWTAIKAKVTEKLAFDEPFRMTTPEYFHMKEVLEKVMTKEELEDLTGFESDGCEAYLKVFHVLPTDTNICLVSQMAYQILQSVYGVKSFWEDEE